MAKAGRSPEAGRKKKKINIAALTENWSADERARLKRLLKQTKFRFKSEEKQRELLPKLMDIVKNNSERRTYEDTFAHNVTVADKHEKRVRLNTRWRFYTFLFTGSFILLLVGYLLYAYVLVVDEIVVEGTERYSAEDIVAASGILVGTNLYSPSIDEDAAASAIIERFPYIGEVKVERRLPNKIVLAVSEETPTFVSNVHGRYMLLSERMRILEITDTPPSGDYIKLKLPNIKEGVAGRTPVFEDDVLEVILRAAEAVCSDTMREGTSVLDVSDRFNISISYGGRFKLVLGSISDIEIKLSLAFRIMEDEVFADGNKGTIYLDDVNRPSAIPDNGIDLD